MNSDLTGKVLDFISQNVKLKHFAEQAILNGDGSVVGYNVHTVLVSGEVMASGTHQLKAMARQIAIAETLERISMHKLADSEQANRLGLKKVPSTSGFAVGFENEATRMRAICEGLERWAWSQWIDKGYEIKWHQLEAPYADPLAVHLSESFDSVKHLQKEISIPELNCVLHLGITLGFKDNGVFAGSRVSLPGQDLWTHGLIEAHRNLTNFKIKVGQPLDPSDWFMNRVLHFGKNSHEAMAQIENAKNPQWPTPKLHVLTEAQIENQLFTMWRCLFSDFVPWHEGPVTRFVY